VKVPKVFISYSYDSKEHGERVLALSDHLRQKGIDSLIDQYEVSPPEGWPRWMVNKVEWADFVLVVCTETYNLRFRGKALSGQGKGVKWEGAILTQELYNAEAQNTRFIPVVFASNDTPHIPVILQGQTYYDVTTERGYEDLYRHLTNQPRILKHEIGKLLKSLPPLGQSWQFIETTKNNLSQLKLGLLFAAPLVYKNEKQIISSLNTLDFIYVRDHILRTISDTREAIEVCVAPATTKNLSKLVLDDYNAIHYHSYGHPEFLLIEEEDGLGLMNSLKANELEVLLKGVQLVIVSSCNAHKAAQIFVEAGIPHVVAIQLKETAKDRDSYTFIQVFYDALIMSNNVESSFKRGVASVINLSSTAKSKKFLLLPKDGSHDSAIFAKAPSGTYKDKTQKCISKSLKIPLPYFLGRNIDIYNVITMLDSKKFVSIWGAPGIGKTELANAVAHRICERGFYSDGVFIVNLKGKQSKQSVDAVRDAISFSVSDVKAQNDDELFNKLRNCHCLVVLDNCDDLLNSCRMEFRDFLYNLYRNTPNTFKLLLTSQERITIQESGEYLVNHLDLTYTATIFYRTCNDPEKIHTAIKTDNEKDSILVLEKHNIIKWLQGHPFMIVLVASLLRDMTFEELHKLLEEKNIGAVIKRAELENDSNYIEPLDPVKYLRERNNKAFRLFTLMGLLPAGAFAKDIKAIWDEYHEGLMKELSRRSLVQFKKQDKYYYTYTLVTDYAKKCLTHDEYIYFNDLICKHFAGITKELYDKMHTNKAEDAYKEFELQEENIWACLVRTPYLQQKQQNEVMSPIGCIATYLPEILLLTSRVMDALRAGEFGLDACDKINDLQGKGRVIKVCGAAKVRLGKPPWKDADIDYKNALEIQQRIGDKKGEAQTLKAYADLKAKQGDHEKEKAIQYYEKSLEIYNHIDAPYDKAYAFKSFADFKMQIGKTEEAEKFYRDSLELRSKIGDSMGEASTLKSIGDLQLRKDNIGGAKKYYEKSLEIRQHIKDLRGAADVTKAIADLMMQLARSEKDYEKIEKYYQDALKLQQEIGDKRGEAFTLQSLGDLKRQENKYDDAKKYYDEASSICTYFDDPLCKANILEAYGRLKQLQNDPIGAENDYKEAYKLRKQYNDPHGEAVALELLGQLTGNKEYYKTALSLYKQLKDTKGENGVLEALSKLEDTQRKKTSFFILQIIKKLPQGENVLRRVDKIKKQAETILPVTILKNKIIPKVTNFLNKK